MAYGGISRLPPQPYRFASSVDLWIWNAGIFFIHSCYNPLYGSPVRHQCGEHRFYLLVHWISVRDSKVGDVGSDCQPVWRNVDVAIGSIEPNAWFLIFSICRQVLDFHGVDGFDPGGDGINVSINNGVDVKMGR